MENKVLVKIYVPMLDESYDIFLPVNDYVWKINKYIVKLISDLSSGVLPINKNYIIANIDTGTIYDNNTIVINTDIRNSTKLILLEA